MSRFGYSIEQEKMLYIKSSVIGFYVGMCSMGISALSLAWLVCNPSAHVGSFVMANANSLLAICFVTGKAIAWNGLSYFLNIDIMHGEEVSWIPLFGFTIMCGLTWGINMKFLAANYALRLKIFGK